MNFVGLDQDAIVHETGLQATLLWRPWWLLQTWCALANWKLMYDEESRDARERARLRECASS